MSDNYLSPEHERVEQSKSQDAEWRSWGSYLSGRQWGTVREDYSADGSAWDFFPFEHSHLRAYRWGEDGLGGLCDRFGFLNFASALWNRKDPILKERLFGVANTEGNHGEDAKEYWWAIDSTPTHSWMQWLYRYPQAEFPYSQLLEENKRRQRTEREFELADTGVLAENRFFDVTTTYAKNGPEDIAIELTATNCGPEAAPIDVIPHWWLRNTWSWGTDDRKPVIADVTDSEENPYPDCPAGVQILKCVHTYLGTYYLAVEGDAQLLFCDNESNEVELFGNEKNPSPYPKDGINRRVVRGDESAVNPDKVGTKVGIWYSFDNVEAGQSVSVRLRLFSYPPEGELFGETFDSILATRKDEADQFYSHVISHSIDEEEKNIARRAYAGLLWNKQLYRYDVQQWLQGDEEPVSPERQKPEARNVGWRNFDVADIISMPDEWEYPWFAAWDLAFHCLPLARIDVHFAKEQILLMCREWAMHPNGQLPAYEWEFSDVNPPVHAWAAWHIYCIDGHKDKDFLVKVFTKLLLNFSWWVNRKDSEGSGIFEGGFMGMDNIALFDRSRPLPPGFRLEQSDATSWMAFYCQQMLKIALELSRYDSAWQDMATKFLEHFLTIAHSMNTFGTHSASLWDEEDGFYYDVLVQPDGSAAPMKVRSMVGLLPILGATDVPLWISTGAPEVIKNLRWLQKRRPEMVEPLLSNSGPNGSKILLALVDPNRLRRILERMFDPDEFLSPYGIRSMSKQMNNVRFDSGLGEENVISYEPGESQTNMFGGNSNWRGPIWFPVNVLLADKLRTYGQHFGEDFLIEIPTGSGNTKTLEEAADYLEYSLVALFKSSHGRRPCDGDRIESTPDPLWQDHVTFNEYFDGNTGEGLGASHQTGWTALVAHLLNPHTGDEEDNEPSS